MYMKKVNPEKKKKKEKRDIVQNNNQFVKFLSNHEKFLYDINNIDNNEKTNGRFEKGGTIRPKRN